MIMDTQEIGAVEGNMPVYRQSTMGISEAAKRHIMKQLSSFYNDPMRAVLREYYANAIDSHKKAGVTRPVEIQLPSLLHPTFWVRDWGTGMSEEFILDVYNWYGESTKQGEEDSIGHFGFGSKSGFAIASQFSVISYYEGMKYSINFLKAPDGAYKGDIVSARETDEPNGVLVSIPIEQNKVADFNATAEKFFKYVDPDTVLVNNEKPSSIFEQGDFVKMAVDGGIEVWADISQKISQNYYYNDNTKTFKFVMGGVTYDISHDQYRNSLSRIGVSSIEIQNALFVIPLGSILIGGNREGVQDSEKTNDMLDKCLRHLVDSLKISIQDKIDNLDDYAEVMKVFKESKKIVVDSSAPYTYKNKAVTEKLDLDTPVKNIFKAVGVGLGWSEYSGISLSNVETIITGVADSDLFLEKEKNSFLPYVKSVGHSVSFIVVPSLQDLISSDEEFKIIDNSNKTIISYQDFQQVVKDYRALQREAAAARKAAGIVPGAPKGKTEVRLPVLDLDTSSLSWPKVSDLSADDLVYVWSRHMPEPNHWDSFTMRQIITMNLSVFEGERNSGYYDRLARSLRVLTRKKKVVLLAGTRTPSFLEKNLKGVSCILDEIEEKLVEFEKNISADTVKKLETATHPFTVLARNAIPEEAVALIEDEEFREALYNAPANSTDRVVLTQYLEHLEYMRFSKYDTWSIRRRFNYQKGGDSGTDFRIKYPLLEHVARYKSLTSKTLDHVIKYINSTNRDLISEQNTATLKTTKG